MAKRETFTRRSLEGIADNKDAERDLKHFDKVFKRGDIVPESIWTVANAMLAERSRALSFSSRRPYAECMREVLHRDPHLRLGVGPYMYDSQFSAIEFIEEDESHDAT